MRLLAIIAICATAAACTHPRQDVQYLRACGASSIWLDDAGHRWLGWNIDGSDLYRVADKADLRDVCPEQHHG